MQKSFSRMHILPTPGSFQLSSLNINKMLEKTILPQNHFKPQTCDTVAKSCTIIYLIELDDGKIYRKNLYLMVKTMVSCRFSLKSIHYLSGGVSRFSQKIGVYPSTFGWNSWNQPGAFLAAAGGRFEDVLPPGLKWPFHGCGAGCFWPYENP